MDTEIAYPIRLLIVDDHALFRRGLIALLSQDRRFSIVGEAENAEAALDAADKLQPDAILLDNHMPGLTGIAAIGSLKKIAPKCQVLMLTVSESPDDLAAAIRAGAAGYLLKTINTEDLADSVEKIVSGDTIISPEMMTKLVGLLRNMPQDDGLQAPAPDTVQLATDVQPAEMVVQANDPIHDLSPRETEILRLIACGNSNKHIARELDIAETTVKIHVQHILRKLNISNRVHAAVYATTRGL
ncbi:response regulator transcription factor [Orrella daihaiensis]|uniref:Response regulator transcription factor n=2 Tax=Orrella daihaiensis TaxID=2782176 RepID=A0ABY4AMJ1_9BURK|nr:response regulator transcription factor [Orrella daihaiensis]